ncbi:MAG: putative DNA binding domain-containing protein [Clostridiales bacterium]|nr:putative DNA binding domain-containing protein [Clostridiales bacterium]
MRKTVIAFANTSGGVIYVGVTDNGKATGLDDLDGTMLKIANSIRDSIKPDVTLFVSYENEEIDRTPVLKVIVQKGTAAPYYLAGKGIRPEGVYVRQGASTAPATDTAILRMIKETDGEKYEDVRSLNQELTFLDAEKEFFLRDVQFGISQQKTLGIMTAGEIFTNLGLLLSDQCVHTVKLAIFEGLAKETFKDRREFSGSLFKQMNDAYTFIDLCNHTRAEFEGLRRIDKRDYPVEAVREALLNALIHRDYSFSSSTLVSVFDDRMEFVSIGGLTKGITLNDIMLGVSVARNERLATVFYRLELIEAYGVGMPKIMRSYENYPHQPKIEVTDNAFKITLPNLNAEIKNGSANDRFSENEQTVLTLFDSKPSIVRKDIEKTLSISQAMAVRVIKGLLDKNAVRVIGGGKNTKYVRSV